ncbi:MAG: 50S ribosomal protein L27 [Elusimicrobiota bacterium]
MARRRSPGCVANGRDSGGQMLGIKAWGSQTVTTGSVLIRQKGTTYFPGKNVGLSRDHTLFALADGVVKFGHGRNGRRTVSIVPQHFSQKQKCAV